MFGIILDAVCAAIAAACIAMGATSNEILWFVFGLVTFAGNLVLLAYDTAKYANQTKEKTNGAPATAVVPEP